jgi:phytanoyl-CoA hydroxylase
MEILIINHPSLFHVTFKIGIIKSEDLSNVNSIFTTNDQTRKSDEYFLSSGREVRFFWEEKAWKDGKLILPPEVAINKVGHGLHDLIPEFENVSYDKNIALICKDLNFEKPLATQSMYIFKQAYVGG